MHAFDRDGLTFDVQDGGPPDGDVAVLLHGWPGGARTWDRVSPDLHQAGLRTLVPDQRGYSPGARPPGRRAYALTELVADVVALLDAAGLTSVHLVGHDWGGAVAWALAAHQPQLVTSLTVLSTPHPRAMARSFRSSDQALRSAYMAAFQVPFVPERLLLAAGGAPLRAVLRRSGLPGHLADAYVDRMQEPGALGASLAWYRALLVSREDTPEITVPTRYLWSTGDAALGRRAAELTAEQVVGPYRFDVVEGASHWLPEERPELVAAAIVEHAGSAEAR